MNQVDQVRKYSVFISYRHADNIEKDRRWADWLHEALETYEVPWNLVGKTNQRNEIVPSTLYPVFKDEEELPADADLTANIRIALENSMTLLVICSPRSVRSHFVAEEIRYFKELGKGDRILALLVDGEPNASDASKANEFGVEAECFPHYLRFGVSMAEREIDWTARTELIAADVRPQGRATQGWTTAAAYREHLLRHGVPDDANLEVTVREYVRQLERAKLKIIAGVIGRPLGELSGRDQANQLLKAQEEEQQLRKWLVITGSLGLIAMLGLIVAWWQMGRARTERANANAAAQFVKTSEQRVESAESVAKLKSESEAMSQAEKLQAVKKAEDTELRRQKELRDLQEYIDLKRLDDGRHWFTLAKDALARGENQRAVLLAARSIDFQGYGRLTSEDDHFNEIFPLLLSKPMQNGKSEAMRQRLVDEVRHFVDNVSPPLLFRGDIQAEGNSDYLTFSPDGTRVAFGTSDWITLVDSASGGRIKKIKGGVPGFSLDGQFLAIMPTFRKKELIESDPMAGIIIANADTGALVTELNHAEYGPSSFAFAPRTGCRHSLKGTISTEGEIARSSDGKWKAFIDVDKVALFKGDVRRSEVYLPLGGVTAVAFSPDGMRLACARHGFISLYDMAGRVLKSNEGHKPDAFCPDPILISNDKGLLIATASAPSRIEFWDTTIRRAIFSVKRDNDDGCISLSADGMFLVSGGYRKIQIWNLQTGLQSEISFSTTSADSQKDWVSRIAFSPKSDRLACQTFDEVVRLWDFSKIALIEIDQSKAKETMNDWCASLARSKGDGREVDVSLEDIYTSGYHRRLTCVEGSSWLDVASQIRGYHGDIMRGDIQDHVIATGGRKGTHGQNISHLRQETLGRLASADVPRSMRTELRMKLCAELGNHLAATGLWRSLIEDDSTKPLPDSGVRRYFLTALIDATRRSDDLGHPTICQTAAQIVPVLTKEMMATPTISLAMMSLMQTLAKDESADMRGPREALMKRLDEVASKEWLEVLRDSAEK